MKVRDTIAVGMECFRKLYESQMQVPLSTRLSSPESCFSKLIGSGGDTGEEIQYCFFFGKNDLFAACSILDLDPAMPGYDTRQTLTFLTVGLTGTGKSELCHWMTGNSEKLF